MTYASPIIIPGVQLLFCFLILSLRNPSAVVKYIFAAAPPFAVLIFVVVVAVAVVVEGRWIRNGLPQRFLSVANL